MPCHAHEYHKIRDNTLFNIAAYINLGQPPGHFLGAVLTNDLKEAVTRADEGNLATLPAIVGYLYNKAPAHCWGSEDRVKAWLDWFTVHRSEIAPCSLCGGRGCAACAASGQDGLARFPYNDSEWLAQWRLL